DALPIWELTFGDSNRTKEQFSKNDISINNVPIKAYKPFDGKDHKRIKVNFKFANTKDENTTIKEFITAFAPYGEIIKIGFYQDQITKLLSVNNGDGFIILHQTKTILNYPVSLIYNLNKAPLKLSWITNDSPNTQQK